MRFFTVLIFTFLFTFPAFSQLDTTVVPFISYWSKGDSYDFQITKIKRKWSEDKLTKEDSSAYTVNFFVMDSTADSYTIKWSYNTNLEAFGVPKERYYDFKKYAKTEVIYKTTELGEFVEITNWKEISEMMLELFDNTEKYIVETTKTDAEKLKETLLPIRQIYTSQQGIEQLVFKELQYFHFPFGLEYEVDATVEYETLLPNMFGGDPISGETLLYVEEVDFEHGYCMLIQEMVLNKKDTKKLIDTMFKKMGIEDDKYNEFMQDAVIEVNDFNVFEYFYNPGVPYRIETNRMVNVQVEKTISRSLEINRIELILD